VLASACVRSGSFDELLQRDAFQVLHGVVKALSFLRPPGTFGFRGVKPSLDRRKIARFGMEQKLLAGWSMRRSVLVAMGFAVAGMAMLVRWLNQPSAIYSMEVSELASRGLWDRLVRLRGTLVKGTLCTEGECGYRFRIADLRTREQLQVQYGGRKHPTSKIAAAP
jgi:hypothetical protein